MKLPDDRCPCKFSMLRIEPFKRNSEKQLQLTDEKLCLIGNTVLGWANGIWCGCWPGNGNSFFFSEWSKALIQARPILSFRRIGTSKLFSLSPASSFNGNNTMASRLSAFSAVLVILCIIVFNNFQILLFAYYLRFLCVGIEGVSSYSAENYFKRE